MKLDKAPADAAADARAAKRAEMKEGNMDKSMEKGGAWTPYCQHCGARRPAQSPGMAADMAQSPPKDAAQAREAGAMEAKIRGLEGMCAYLADKLAKMTDSGARGAEWWLREAGDAARQGFFAETGQKPMPSAIAAATGASRMGTAKKNTLKDGCNAG